MICGPWTIDFLISKLLIALLRNSFDFCSHLKQQPADAICISVQGSDTTVIRCITAAGDIIIILQFING